MEKLENTEGFFYGYGIFETLKIINKEIFNSKNHYVRLKKSAEELNIKFTVTYEKFLEICSNEIDKYNENLYVLKFILIKNGDNSQYFFNKREYKYNEKIYIKGFNLRISSIKKNETSKIICYKTLNYLENILELKNSKNLGFDECIFLNTKGYVTEGATSNIFIVKNKTIYTPKISDGILEGTMRTLIIKKCMEKNIKIIEKSLSLEEVLNGDEIFLSNSLMGILKVNSIENKKFTSKFIENLKKIINL